MNIVIVTETIPYVGVQRKDAPWGRTFDDMVKYAKENPGKVSYISNQVGSGNDIAMEWVLAQLGIEVNKIPAPNTEAQAATMGAGEGDFALTQAPAAMQLYQGDRVDVTFVTGDTVPPPWDKDQNVVSATGYGLPPAPFGIIEGILVPKQVPEEHIAWLADLFRAAAETDTYKKREETVPGLKVRIIERDEANEMKMKVLEYVDPVVRELGMHVDQK
jgi:tripartite-type tricarboxylate transporter receptor subunit TctC